MRRDVERISPALIFRADGQPRVKVTSNASRVGLEQGVWAGGHHAAAAARNAGDRHPHSVDRAAPCA